MYAKRREGGRVSSGQTYERRVCLVRRERTTDESSNIMGSSPGARDNLSVMKVKI